METVMKLDHEWDQDDLIDLGDATSETKGLQEGAPSDAVGFIKPSGLSDD
jgi:hypothetical protein